GDVHVRLSLYKRIAAAESEAALDDLAAEIQDRFGPLPPAAQSLLRIARLKLAARALGVRRLDLGPQGGTVLFEEQSRIDPATVVHMIQSGSREYRLDGPLRLRVAPARPPPRAPPRTGARRRASAPSRATNRPVTRPRSGASWRSCRRAPGSSPSSRTACARTVTMSRWLTPPGRRRRAPGERGPVSP